MRNASQLARCRSLTVRPQGAGSSYTSQVWAGSRDLNPLLFWFRECGCAQGYPPGLGIAWLRAARAQTLRQCLTQFTHPRRLAQDAIDMWWSVSLRRQPLTPARQHDEDRARSRALDGERNLAAVNVRHAEIGNHDCEGSFLRLCGKEHVDPRLPTVRRAHRMPVCLERFAQRFQYQRIVVHEQDLLWRDSRRCAD